MELIEDNSLVSPVNNLTTKDLIGFFAMVVGMFMAILDIQIVASSLAEIQAGLSATRNEISWVQTSYLMAEVIVIPLTGFLSRAFSTRILFCTSALGFTIMSGLCACSWNLTSMICFRAFQGLLGGMMIPTVFSTIFFIFPKEKIPTINIIVGLVVTVAPIAGPTLGGYITELLSWHWMFLINIPFGILITFVIWHYLDIDKPNLEILKKCDWFGLIYMCIFLASIEFFLEEGEFNDWFESNVIKVSFGIIVVSAILFFRRILSHPSSIIDIRAFNNKNFAIGCIFGFILGMGLYGSAFLLPSFLSAIRQFNSLQIGQVMAITGMFQFLSAPVAGMLSKKNIDLRIMLSLGLALFGLGLHLNSNLTCDSDFGHFFIPQMIIGFSIMFCFIPINTLALGTMNKNQVKNASGLYNLMRNLGGAIGLAILGSTLNSRMKLHFQHISETISAQGIIPNIILNQSNQFLNNKIQFANKFSLSYINNIVNREALVMAFNDCYYLVSCFFFIATLVVPFMKKA